MGRSKSTSSQQNTYAYAPAPPPNPYLDMSKQLLEGYDGGAGQIREGHARNINDIKESGNEFFGASTPDYVRDKVRDSRLFRNNTELGRNLAGAKTDEIQTKNQGYMSLGGMTMPQLVQTGSSGQGTQTQSGLQSASQVMGILGA